MTTNIDIYIIFFLFDKSVYIITQYEGQKRKHSFHLISMDVIAYCFKTYFMG